jgi:ribonuclease HI
VVTKNVLTIYTDGSCLPKPRRGGIGVRFIYTDPDGIEEFTKDFEEFGFQGSTNNQMELYACVFALNQAAALDFLHRITLVEIRTDSMYVSENYKRAMYQWCKNRWLNNYGKPVENAGLWKDLIKGIIKLKKKVEITWVKGHSKDAHNKAVDKLAKQSAKKPLNKPLAFVDVRRKKSKKTTVIGSVGTHGQRISIRIISSEYLKVQKIWKLRYEVISKCSPYSQNVDFVYSADVLRVGHSYSVRLNNDAKNPSIQKVYKEILKNTPTIDQGSK